MSNLKMKHKKILQVEPATKQRTILTMKNRNPEEAQRILHQRGKTHQKTNAGFPVKYANNLHIRDYSDAQTLRSTYQGVQMEQLTYPRTYASSVSELYSRNASTMT